MHQRLRRYRCFKSLITAFFVFRRALRRLSCYKHIWQSLSRMPVPSKPLFPHPPDYRSNFRITFLPLGWEGQSFSYISRPIIYYIIIIIMNAGANLVHRKKSIQRGKIVFGCWPWPYTQPYLREGHNKITLFCVSASNNPKSLKVFIRIQVINLPYNNCNDTVNILCWFSYLRAGSFTLCLDSEFRIWRKIVS